MQGSVREPRLILLNKPYNVLCQFTDESGSKQTLANYLNVPGVYPAGRLDYDSEGLVILTDTGWLQHRIADPSHKEAKTYWVQVEGIPGRPELERLSSGVVLKDGLTRPASASLLEEPPPVWLRCPPIRVRKNIPDAWLELTLREGRNRQVRRMTAAVGHPTLRLIRVRIGEWELGTMQPGEWRAARPPVRER